MATKVHGVLQENGDFIFHIKGANNIKMVRTTNSGVFINSGFLHLPTDKDWQDSEKWIEKPYYNAVNFIGGTG